MQDGLGLVFEQQGNTGAAAYNQPTGDGRLDRIAQNINQEYNTRLGEQLYQDRLNLAEEKKNQNPQFPNQLWFEGHQKELGQSVGAYRKRAAELGAKGVKRFDYNNPESGFYEEGQRAVYDQLNTAKRIEDDYLKMRERVLADRDSKTPQFDTDKTLENIDNWFHNGKIADKAKVNPASLFVEKPAQFDTYEAIADLKGNDFSNEYSKTSGDPTYDSTRSGNEFDRKRATNNVAQWYTNTEQGQKNLAAGIAKGTWKNLNEAIDTQVQRLETLHNSKSTTSFKRKEPKEKKGLTLIDIENGNADDLIATLGVGTQTPQVRSAVTGDFVPTLAKNAITLGNINATISGNTAIDASKGKPFDKNARTITSGTMSTPLVNKGTNRLVAIPKDGGVYRTRINGKDVDLEGTYEEIAQQLIDAGVAEYKPMIEGTGTYGGKPFTAWVPADAVVQGTQQKDKALEGAEQAYYILKKKSDQLNGTAGTKQIKKSDVATDAAAAGYTVEEYTALLKKNGFTIID